MSAAHSGISAIALVAVTAVDCTIIIGLKHFTTFKATVVTPRELSELQFLRSYIHCSHFEQQFDYYI
jgi:hypothetical protein